MIEKGGKTYLTVKEFAIKASVSPQAVYKRLNKLESYVIRVDNQNYIEETALDFFVVKRVDKPVINVESGQNTEKKEDTNKEDTKETESQIYNTNKELFEILKEELRKKDEEIKRLQERLDHAQDLIADMSQKAQMLAIADKQERILQQQTKEETIEAAAAEKESAENSDSMEKEVEKQPKGIKEFFKRLFS